MVKKVLISGAGIAGPVLAFWLSRAGIHSTILEKSPSLPTGGQQIDMRGAALEVVRRMGLEETVRSRTTKEDGLHFVDGAGNIKASFPVDKNGGRSFTSEIEILRGDLAKVFCDAAADAEFIFGDQIADIVERDDDVEVRFESGKVRPFDLVVAADGMRSATRRLVFGAEDYLKHLGMYTCYFTIPGEPTDGTWSKWYSFPGRRTLLTRPDTDRNLRAFLSVISDRPADYYNLGVSGQKDLMRDIFANAGGKETQRVLDGMARAPDFYMQEIAQVKMDKWSKGRVVLLGDAGYCPSPISGMGTSLAITGAYHLAGEIARSNKDGDWRQGLREYERKMRVRVDKAQKLPPGAPALANPETKWGITVLQTLLYVASKTGLASWLLSSTASADDEIEEYRFEEDGR